MTGRWARWRRARQIDRMLTECPECGERAWLQWSLPTFAGKWCIRCGFGVAPPSAAR